MRVRESMDGWAKDLRFAARQYARAPGFFLIAVATLALGIGATTAIFSVVRGVLLRPLPYPDADRIVQLWQLNDAGNTTQFSDPNFADLKARSRSFAALAQQAATGTITVGGAAEAVRTRGAVVSREFFDVLRVRPVRGRLFDEAELRENGPLAVLVSHGFWQRVLGGTDDVIGSRLLYDGAPYTIIGVLPATLQQPPDAELWVARETEAPRTSRTAQNWQVIGRLADGVTVEQARREISTIARQLKEQHGRDTWMVDATLLPLRDQLVGRSRGTLLVLLAGSLLLLLIACANVVNLLVARMTNRQAEVALRIALGATPQRIARQCLAEALLLALGAAVLGALLATAGVRLLLVLQPENLPRLDDIRVDAAVLTFSLLLATTAAVGMGVITAWRSTRGVLRDALAQSQRTQSGTLSSERLRRGLVVAQVAMAVVLLVATALFAHSFQRLLAVDPGFRVEGQVIVDVAPSGDGSERIRFYDALATRLTAIPGVRTVGAVNVMPLGGTTAGDGTFIIMQSVTEPLQMSDYQRLMQDPARVGEAEYRIASEGYFAAMGIPVEQGRVFTASDVQTAPHVAVISASLRRARWPTEDPIGKVIQFGNMDGDLTPFTIVGVVGDVRERSLAGQPRPTVYATYRQRPRTAGRMNFVVATSREPAAVIGAALRTVRDIRPDVPPRARAVEAVVATSVADRRFVLTLASVFGACAMFLAALGIYSVISYLVTQRSREIGIRVALGARAEDVVRMVLRQGLTLAAAGIVAGTALALVLTRLVAGMLYGVRPTDPVAFLAVVVVLAAVALLASWAPARRAARVPAMEVLRTG